MQHCVSLSFFYKNTNWCPASICQHMSHYSMLRPVPWCVQGCQGLVLAVVNEWMTELMNSVLGSALYVILGMTKTWDSEMNFVVNHAPSAGSIAWPVDPQYSTLPLYHGCPFVYVMNWKRIRMKRHQSEILYLQQKKYQEQMSLNVTK